MIDRTIAALKSWAKRLKSEIYTLYVAMRDPRTPAHAKYLAILVIGYALSPIDLIPDFIPVLGLLDDLILLPVGIALLRRMIPSIVLASARQQAESLIRAGLPASRNAAMVIVTIWALVLTGCIWWFINRTIHRVAVTTDSVNIEETTRNPNARNRPQISENTAGKEKETDRSRSRER